MPPGDIDACVKRFVAGDTDDRLDGVMVVSLPTDKFLTKNDQNEATFTGSYEIWLLNLSTLAEDRHAFTFEDREPVVGGVTAILTIPAQFLSQAAGGGKLVSSNVYQAYQSVQNRVEAKLVAATKLYLASSPLGQIGPLKQYAELRPAPTINRAICRFVQVEVDLPVGAPRVVLPATAIAYAPYGNSVFIVEKMKDTEGQEYLGVRQQIVKLGRPAAISSPSRRA